MPIVENWRVVRRMSLMNNNFHYLDASTKCKELTTLLLQHIGLENISCEFFKTMPNLVILDLSGNGNLKFLDGISTLVSLQYLNLSWTDIGQFPEGLQELKKLIHLDMERTQRLSSIVGISRVHNLKVLKLRGSLFSWDLKTVKELENLEHLEILTTTIRGLPILEHFLRSHRLPSRKRCLDIFNCSSKVESLSISLPVFMDKLHDFRIWHCDISKIKMGRTCSFLSLVKMDIHKCGSLRELTFLIFAPNLKYLIVEKADQLEDIINKEKACEVGFSGIVPLQRLINLDLSERRTFSFLSLARVAIEECDSLRDLTFFMFAPNLRLLYVKCANQLEDIINKEKVCEVGDSGTVPFQKLNNLRLYGLPKLKNIYWNPLPFSCLQTIKVIACESLKKLPLNSKSGMPGENGLFTISARKEWIEGLEWEDDATKTRFLASWEHV